MRRSEGIPATVTELTERRRIIRLFLAGDSNLTTYATVCISFVTLANPFLGPARKTFILLPTAEQGCGAARSIDRMSLLSDKEAKKRLSSARS